MHTSDTTTEGVSSSARSPETTQTSSSAKIDAPDPVTRALIIVISLTLLLSFFLPWVNFLGVDLSGFNLQKLSDANRVFWLVPFLASCTVILALAKRNSGLPRYLAGLSPYAILVMSIMRHGPEIIQQFQFGAWLALVAGAALVCIPVPGRAAKGI